MSRKRHWAPRWARCPRGHKIKPVNNNIVALKTPTLAETYKSLCAVLQQSPKQTVLVVNHIAAKHGIHSLPAFQNSDAIGEQDKLVTYGEIVRVLVGKSPASSLQGQVANGQAKEEPPANVVKFEPSDLQKRRDAVIPVAEPAAVSSGTNDNARPPAPEPEPDPEPAEDPSPEDDDPPAAPRNDPAMDQLREALRKVIGPQDAKLDEARVKQIAIEQASKSTTHALNEVETWMKVVSGEAHEYADKAVSEAIAAVKPTVVRHEFQLGNAPAVNLDGAIHRQLPQVIAWVSAGVPVWLWGAAGAGKTHLARQVAAVMSLPFYCAPIDETITVGKLVGFRNVSNGEFVKGLIYDAYKGGGVILLDEIDTNATAIASLNSLLANAHYTFPNGEEVARHANFRVIAGANTKGTGATAGYVARIRMDAATLNRFAVIQLEYDAGLELQIACGVPSTSVAWKAQPLVSGDGGLDALCRSYVEWVQKVRAKVGQSVLVSPRASFLGVQAIRVGIPVPEVADALVFSLVTDDTRRRITDSCGLPQ